MKERGILFSAPMVKALRAGTKTQTRRPVKYPVLDGKMGWHPTPTGFEYLPGGSDRPVCPYGRSGDRLWVRETFWAFGRWETRFSEKKGRDEWHFIDMTVPMDRLYQFADPTPESLRHRSNITPAWWKRPAIFMPRAASRITLDIGAVRVEQLQDISYEDAIAEGMFDPASAPPFPFESKETPEQHGRRTKYPQRAYCQLWEEINGAGSWDTNPWVWVVEFRKIELKQE